MGQRNRGNKVHNDHNTRNKNNSKDGGRDPHTADHNAPQASITAATKGSHTRNYKLPPVIEIQNTTATESVSKQQQFAVPSAPNAKDAATIMPENSLKNNNVNEMGNYHNYDNFGKGSDPQSHAETHRVSDNREASIQTDFPPGDPPPQATGEALSALASELSAIRSKMDTLDKIESSISTLVSQFGGLAERTGKVEAKVDAHDSKFLEVDAELTSLRQTVDRQSKAIAKLTNMKTDLLKQNQEVKADLVQQNKGITKEMNQLLEQQKNQVDSFRSTTKRIENNILERVEQKTEEKASHASQEASFKSLKDQAFAKRCNLVITGLEEDDSKSVPSAVKELFKTLGADKLGIKEAYRLGVRRADDNTYRRPIIVEFSNISDRNKVWRKRNGISSVEGEQRVKIQADLPKFLREEMNILYRITRAAANIDKFKTAVVRNYALQLHGKEFSPINLEQLPFPIRPSTISNPRSEVAIAFFSKYSALSNHHPSPFIFNDQEFQNMEQYLAVQRAKLSGQESIIQRASTAKDPKEAKAILRSLRQDNVQEWSEKVKGITIEGLRAKFTQNEHLLSFLKDTQNLQIGEASKDPRWGVGLDLSDPQLLDTSKWNSEGNLLGKCLMQVRDEFSAPEK